jgi:hypothetical protein
MWRNLPLSAIPLNPPPPPPMWNQDAYILQAKNFML